MPQTNYLPLFVASYPLLARVQKPGGVTVATTATAPRVPNKHAYSAGTVQGSVYATGTITLNDNTMTTQNINVNGTLVTFGTNVTVGGSVGATTNALLAFLQGSIDANIAAMSYSLQSATVILCTSKLPGAVGNTYTLTNGTSTTHVTVSGPTLAGGFLPGGLMAESEEAKTEEAEATDTALMIGLEEESEEEAAEEEVEHDENGDPKPRRSHHRKKSRR